MQVAGTYLSQYQKFNTGTGTTVNVLDSQTFQIDSTTTSGNGGFELKMEARQGDIIKFEVLSCALSKTTLGTNCPSIGIKFYHNGKEDENSTNTYICDTNLKKYSISYTVQRPVVDGDFIEVSFGCWGPATIGGYFTQPSIYLEKSASPVRREILAGFVRLDASSAGTYPTIVQNENYAMLPPESMVWNDENTILITDARLKSSLKYRTSSLSNIHIVCDDSTSDFNKIDPYIGLLNQTDGTIKIKFFDKTTNTVINFNDNASKKLSFIYNIYKI